MATRGGTGSAARLAPQAPLSALPGVGPATATRLAAQGFTAAIDLVLFFPRRYRQLRELSVPAEAAVGELVRLPGRVHTARRAWLPGRRSLVTVVFAAADGSTFEVRFHNQPWLAKSFTIGQTRLIEGELRLQKGRYVLQPARVLPTSASPAGEVQLRYREVEGVSAARLAQWIGHCLDHLDWSLLHLPPLPAALASHDHEVRELLLAMHRPSTVAQHERARLHFAVREAMELFAAVERARRARARRPARAFAVDPALRERILARIPFALTDDQAAAIERIWTGLAGPAALGMLLQGDVGSGKTAVAIAAALAVVARGGQVAFLAPTEVLAEQHHATVSRWLQDSGVQVLLVTASQRQRAVADGPQLLFGTHALFAAESLLPRLGLVIVDEQHRFGVAQRMALVNKADNPHVLVMTATPIPRTLALTLFGDLDVVTLRHKPQGHRPVPARQLPADRWSRALRCIGRAVRRGGRVFVVCPAVGEDGEKGGVVRVEASLAPRFRCGSVHG
ncbi:MAG: DEAD/DEAH box helicase, partial [Planctomycetes bacterium]|nr:DEAD/DEAH box helicase [Planctomycetota bacterium]